MKTTVLAENLRKGLGVVIKAVASRPQLPILSGVMMVANKDGLELRATDLEMSLLVRLGAKVEVEGELVVPARIFWELVSGLPVGPIEMTVEKQTLRLVGGGVKAEIVGQAVEEFPTFAKAKGKGCDVDAIEFCKKVSRVVVSAAKDDTRPVLSGICWVVEKEKVNLVATDGYRLGVEVLDKVEGELVDKMILPARSLQEWVRIVMDSGEQKIKIEYDGDNQQVIMISGEIEMTSRLIAGEFPPYRQIIPNNSVMKATINRQDLLDAVKRASLFARENANVVKVEMMMDKVVVKAESSQVGNNETEMLVSSEGQDVTMAFNARYLIEYLTSIDDREVVMETEGELKPGVFKVLSDGFLQLVMPIRV